MPRSSRFAQWFLACVTAACRDGMLRGEMDPNRTQRGCGLGSSGPGGPMVRVRRVAVRCILAALVSSPLVASLSCRRDSSRSSPNEWDGAVSMPPRGGGPVRLDAGKIPPRTGCPTDMVRIEGYCVDRYEAPNIAGEYPLVMQSAVSAEAWCQKRGKRLCAEDEWELACAGPTTLAYPYGPDHEKERCNDNKTWIQYDEPLLGAWPSKESMQEVSRLYQAEKSGGFAGCESVWGVYDLTGNVEEWVVRRASGVPVLKGCYWSGCYGGSKPTCQGSNAAHGAAFRFYETGFRCCSDIP